MLRMVTIIHLSEAPDPWVGTQHFTRTVAGSMVSRGYETIKRLLVSGLRGGGPETLRPKETQGESLESRDYATQRDPRRIS